jgi:F0F1-type ATP synthase epsilon subunit
MQLIIVSPFAKKIIDIEWIELNTPAGNYIIQAEHAPTIVTLTPGKPIIYLTTQGKEESWIVTQAIVQVTRSSVTLVTHDTLT